jgi:hypothetical protein
MWVSETGTRFGACLSVHWCVSLSVCQFVCLCMCVKLRSVGIFKSFCVIGYQVLRGFVFVPSLMTLHHLATTLCDAMQMLSTV